MLDHRKFDRTPYGLDDWSALGEWPRRLLHVPTMRSHERLPGDIYNGVTRPPYSTLSYTWGRFEVPPGTRPAGPRRVLPVSGISWAIPEIRPDAFTVDEFQIVLQKASAETGWLWVDVACIDQEDVVARDEEVGRQAAIFRNGNAMASFIWLHQTSLATLQRLADILFEAESNVDRVLGTTAYTKYSEAEPPNDVCFRAWVDNVSETLSILESEPWFSSLWTLQEGFLRPEATILSKEGQMPQRVGFDSVGLASLLSAWGEINRMIRLEKSEWLGRSESETVMRYPVLWEANGIVSRMEKLGVLTFDNPNLLYSLAGFRQTKHAEDRIYGIMQCFGLKLGKAAMPGTYFTLRELEMQFALALNEKSTLWGQLFVHMRPQPPGYHWCISQSSALPECLAWSSAATLSHSKMTFDRRSNQAIFSGWACPFVGLKEAWDLARAVPGFFQNFWQSASTDDDAPLEFIALDRNKFAESHVPAELQGLDHYTELHPINQTLGEVLRTEFGQTLKVLLLGQIHVDSDDLSYESEDSEEAGAVDPRLMGSVGLLVRPVRDDYGQSRWRRIGITVWPSLPDPISEQVDWIEVEKKLD